MISKNKIKQLRLFQQKKHRDAEQLFIVEGTKMVLEALASSYTVCEIVALETWILQHGPKIASIPFHSASTEDMSKISVLKTPSDVWALVSYSQQTTQHEHSGLILALDGIQDPGNMGTILRSADWFGLSYIFCSDSCVDVYNPKVVQASMGAIFRVPLVYGNLPDFLSKSVIAVYGAGLEGSSLYSSTIPKDMILVMGNEGNGISADAARYIQSYIHIPGKDTAMESLNVGVATGIICSEYLRQITSVSQ